MLSFNSSVKIFVSGDFNYYHEDWLSYSGGTGIVRTPTPPHPHPIFFSSFIIFIFGNYFAKSSSAAGCSRHQQLTSSVSCSWWWLCFMSKHMFGQVLVLPSQHLGHPAADGDFVKLPYSLRNCVINLKKKKKLFLLPPKFF